MRLLGYLAVAGLTAGAVLGGAGAVAATRADAAAAAEETASLVEDFAYPGAEKILADRDILLKKGDGRLLLTDCAVGADLIQVRSRGRDPFCFEAAGSGAWVTMELSDAFLVFSDSEHTTVADYTVDGVSDSAVVEPGGAAGIGEGQTEGSSAVLLKLTAS
ncbi:secreted protein [Paractinoplanes deccanensis]|uniref:Secreted protein n=1 Tax=Paractinoplanes deccanensis TaxID=113561 RepID=A0ABQ3YF33_9ACTN|nr:hypothetical protein [Actinoplanes deccanensis]GID78609.1 secreted protein [Actinoplanes deccanensis]